MKVETARMRGRWCDSQEEENEEIAMDIVHGEREYSSEKARRGSRIPERTEEGRKEEEKVGRIATWLEYRVYISRKKGS